MVKCGNWLNVFSINQRDKCSKVNIGTTFSVLIKCINDDMWVSTFSVVIKGVNDQRLVLAQRFQY